MSTATLPDKPSELIRVALADLRKVEAMPGTYVVDMENWHLQKNGKCHVCLAGSVISQSMGANPAETIWDTDFDERLSDRLCALDWLRCGYVGNALDVLGLYDRFSPSKVRVTPYEADIEAFHRDMAKLADDLEAAGL